MLRVSDRHELSHPAHFARTEAGRGHLPVDVHIFQHRLHRLPGRKRAVWPQRFIENPGLHRTLIGDGIATSLAGLFGGPANTTYGENTGVLVLSKVYDPRVVRLAAIYAVILSFSPAFAAVINSIPTAIIGGVSFILYGMISAIGVRNVVENRVDFTNSRNLIIAAIILVCGLGFSGGLTFHIGSTAITLTSLAIAAIAGIVLNAILPGKDYEFGSDVTEGRSGDMGRY